MKVEHLICDRDSKYVKEFDEVFEAINCRVEPTALRAPNQSAFIERWGKSLQYECLRFFIVFGRKQLDHLVSCYAKFYNEKRPHQAKENWPLTGKWLDEDEPLDDDQQIICHESLGGILRHYERVAA